MKSAIEITNLTKSYEEFQLEIEKLIIPFGKITGLIGGNGAGKSTLINLILNQIKSENGNIDILGLDNIEKEIKVKEDIAVILENNNLPEMFNVRNVEKMMGLIYSDWDKSLFNQFINQFKLPFNKSISDFSRGMKVKLNFAVALSHNPKVLIIDESTSGLDPIVRKEILSLLSSYVENKELSVFMSSHILSDLEKIADYFVFIHNGKVVLEGYKEKLLNRFMVIKENNFKSNKINKEDICFVLHQNGEDNYLVDMSKSGIQLDAPKADLEEILLFHVKGEKL